MALGADTIESAIASHLEAGHLIATVGEQDAGFEKPLRMA
jgi:hypothetical protein